MRRLRVLLFGLIAAANCCWILAGCCWMSKRSCFPSCPPKLPAKIVKIEKTCELPPLELPPFKSNAYDGGEIVCFDRKNAANLYLRLARLKDFAKTARARCAKLPTSRPASMPASSQPNP